MAFRSRGYSRTSVQGESQAGCAFWKLPQFDSLTRAGSFECRGEFHVMLWVVLRQIPAYIWDPINYL